MLNIFKLKILSTIYNKFILYVNLNCYLLFFFFIMVFLIIVFTLTNIIGLFSKSKLLFSYLYNALFFPKILGPKRKVYSISKVFLIATHKILQFLHIHTQNFTINLYKYRSKKYNCYFTCSSLCTEFILLREIVLFWNIVKTWGKVHISSKTRKNYSLTLKSISNIFFKVQLSQ